MLPKDNDNLKVKPDNENGADPNGFFVTLLIIAVVALLIFLLKECKGLVILR